MENFPVINLENINGEERKTILDQIQDACQNWGFFELLKLVNFLDGDGLTYLKANILAMQQCISFNPLDTIKFIDEIDVVGRLRGTGNDEREQTLNQMRTEMKKLDKDVSLSVIAMKTPGFSGADLANLMNQASILAN
ncbi:ATP-dependent zinc metalloprotease FTSH 2, chloroplastic [Glycine soja]